ncbi:TetR/AcrR family transcriptional regulator [Streptomyces sp. NPDC091972]|uniref:TetR/AcrR family transcriptional regulator n=1 Tax=Streptomyces sp. NPDC091972 TaxID=3366007 RepID=UPI00382F2130
MPTTGPARRTYDSSARQAAAERNRTAVLAAFRDLLTSNGYQATTVKAVASLAGVSTETVYKAFGGKPGLMKALWDVTLAGDDQPMTMAERPALQAVLGAQGLSAKLQLWVDFVSTYHERLAPLAGLLAQAGSAAHELLETVEHERLVGVSAFLRHLAGEGLLSADVNVDRLADACWTITAPDAFTRLTLGRGWSVADYRAWLHVTLTALLRASHP